MRFSVVVATYNAESVLQNAISAFAEQTWGNKELLIADGGSSDATVKILKANDKDIAWWISEADKGIFDAWNKCIRRATGDWIYMMGADDRFYDAAVLANAVRMLGAVPKSTLIAYGQVDIVRADGVPCETLGRAWAPKIFRHVGMSIPHQGVFHRRELFETYGVFDTTDRSTATYELLLRYLKDHDAAYLGPFKVARMQVGGISTNPKNQSRFYSAYIAAQKKHGTYRPNFLLFARVLQGQFKAFLYSTLGNDRALAAVDLMRRMIGKQPQSVRSSVVIDSAAREKP